MSTKYLLISLPTNVSLSNDRDEALTALRSTIPQDAGSTYDFKVPTFKIGALDALLNQADELSKLCNDSEAVVGKVGEALVQLFEGDQDKARQQRNVGDKPIEQYLQTFSWNKVKYRIDKPIAELIQSLKKELASIDTDVRSKLTTYNTTKSSLQAAQRKTTGNLSTRSLAFLDPSDTYTDSEYLTTHLIAVPKQQTKDFLKSYESLAPMTVPRSARELAADKEFALYSVTGFKKTASEFQHKCREKRWTPRESAHVNGNSSESTSEAEAKEISRLEQETQRLGGEALRLARTGYSEAAMTWIHALALRVFVETILRYGLPAEFVAGLVRTTGKATRRCRKTLDGAFGYLGGRAAEGKKGGGEMGQEEGEWSAYVCYEFGVD
ncbi:MAG: hypothetical protein Q9162_003639 [Coniocarpon cinnabarinum]